MNRNDTRYLMTSYLPYLLRDEAECSKARFLLEEVKGLDSRLLMYCSLANLFSKSQNRRSVAYSSLYDQKLIDICLRFEKKGDGSYNDRRFYDKFSNSIPRTPFKDPLNCIVDQESGNVTYFGKLNIFEKAEAEKQL